MHICLMKTRLNVTIDDDLLSKMEAYANMRQTSVSELVEDYFKSIMKPINHKSIINLVEKLELPAIDTTADLKELFYQDQAKKYGF